MDRRFFLVLLLAGCADTSPQGPLTPLVSALPTAAPTLTGSAPSPLTATPVPAGELSFDSWLADFMVRAEAAGLTRQLLER